ncbi:MAG: hypothetical protein IKZ01_01200 [Anaerotignum sp.]|nr:hypothetical protein [Anaerotignum sp.]
MAEMTAVAFLKEWKRMCDDCLDCDDCPMYEIRKNNVESCRDIVRKNPEKSVAIVHHWTEEHSVKTIADDFFEKHPNAPKDEDIPKTCAKHCGYFDDCPGRVTCNECWKQPLEV